MVSMVRRGGVCLDVGANNGVYTYALSRISRQVEAFEPLPACAKVISAFRAHNVRVHQVALSSSTGQRELYVPVCGGAPNTGLASLTRPSGPPEGVPLKLQRLDDH